MPTIENNLSLPVRHALSVRMGVPRLPRPPTLPRSIAQVGLGTARISPGHRPPNLPEHRRRIDEPPHPSRRQRREDPSHTHSHTPATRCSHS
jgi:hypothetical protein